jgi:hypothetical protein
MSVFFTHFNPFLGWYGMDWHAGVRIVFGGLIFGFLREKTGIIVAPSIVYGLVDFFHSSFYICECQG